MEPLDKSIEQVSRTSQLDKSVGQSKEFPCKRTFHTKSVRLASAGSCCHTVPGVKSVKFYRFQTSTVKTVCFRSAAESTCSFIS